MSNKPNPNDRDQSRQGPNGEPHEWHNSTGARTERLAELVASGEVPYSALTNDPDRAHVLDIVARKRRARLVRAIARAIALDIHHTRHERKERDQNA